MQDELKQQMRAEFEAWHRKENGAIDEMFVLRDDGRYAWGRTCDMFAAFQVAWNRRTPVSGEVAEGCTWKGADQSCAMCGDDKAVCPEAQGIDHAKLADELADLLFALILCVKNGDDPKPRAKAIQDFVADIAGWQARGQQAGGAEDATILKLSLDALTAHFDTFIGECMAGAPSAKAIARARACLPTKCVNAFKPKEKT